MKLLLSIFSTCLLTISFSFHSFGGVAVFSVSETNPLTICSSANLTVVGENSAMYPIDQIYHTISGDTVTINIAYTFTTAIFVVTPWTHNIDVGILSEGSYHVVVNGILNSNIQSTISDSISVGPSPINPSFTYPSSICLGEQVQLSNTTTGSTSHLWYINNAPVSSNTTYNFTPTTAGNLSVVLRSINGSCQELLQATILVNDAPVIDSLIASQSSVCLGESIDIASFTSGSTSMQWTENGTFVSNSTNLNLTPNIDGVMTYQLLVGNGVCYDSMETIITVKPLPLIDAFTVSDTILCLGNSVDFSSSSSNANSFEWFENGISTGNSSAYIASPSPEGIYNYTLLVELNGCFDSISQSIEVVGLPTVDLGPDTNNCNGPVVLDAGAGASTYLWQDQSINQTLTPTTTGTYSVTITDNNGCSAYDEIEFESCASLFEDEIGTIELFPNPASSLAEIRMEGYNGRVEVIVSCSNGQVVSKKIVNTSGIIHLDLSELNAGMYFIQLQLDTSMETLRLVKN